jgi:hypothetical protein
MTASDIVPSNGIIYADLDCSVMQINKCDFGAEEIPFLINTIRGHNPQNNILNSSAVFYLSIPLILLFTVFTDLFYTSM